MSPNPAELGLQSRFPNLKAESLPESLSDAKHNFGLNQHNHHMTMNVQRPVSFEELELRLQTAFVTAKIEFVIANAPVS